MVVDNETAFNYSLGALALVAWFIMYRFFSFILQLGPIQNVFAPGETVMTLVPFILGLGASAGSFFAVKRYEPANRFGNEVIIELRKVVWPSRKEVTGTTWAVLVIIFITAMLLFVFDKVFGYMVASLIR